MTILEAIQRLDSLGHNTYSQAQKIGWLSQVDGMVAKDVIFTHEGAPEENFRAYDEQTPLDQQLLVSGPYEELYLHFMEAQMDYHNTEYDRYNRSMGMFQAVWRAFVNDYNRTHRPLGQTFRYF